MAAAREGRTIDLEAVVAFCREAADGPQDILLVEGIGGVMVPLTENRTVLDWMAALGAPALLVVGSYLGAISHTLTAVEVVRGRDIELAGVVVSESPDHPAPLEETCQTIGRFLGTTPVVALHRLPAGDAPWLGAPDLLAPLGLAGP
jgi:dethiobiotin synthetase